MNSDNDAADAESVPIHSRWQIWWCLRCDAVWTGTSEHDCPVPILGLPPAKEEDDHGL